MLVGSRVALNQTQKISTFRALARLVITSTFWYSCPVGRKAHYKGYAILDNLGAAANVHLELNPTGGTKISELMVAADDRVDVEGDMQAGDDLGYDQSIGTNATIDGNFVIQETRA